MDASNLLKPPLARGELSCVGATTLAEYRLIEKDAALARRFQPVLVPEPTPAQSLTILRGLKEKYQAHHGVHITDGALLAAVQMAPCMHALTMAPPRFHRCSAGGRADGASLPDGAQAA